MSDLSASLEAVIAERFIAAVLDTPLPDDVFPMVVQVRDVLAVAEWLAPVHARVCADVWNEGWDAAVDSDGFPGDVNPYRDDTQETP